MHFWQQACRELEAETEKRWREVGLKTLAASSQTMNCMAKCFNFDTSCYELASCCAVGQTISGQQTNSVTGKSIGSYASWQTKSAEAVWPERGIIHSFPCKYRNKCDVPNRRLAMAARITEPD
jgi:hypothetical protein